MVGPTFSSSNDRRRIVIGATTIISNEVNDRLLVVCISFRQLVDRLVCDQSLALTCRVHTDGEAPLQAAVRAPIAPGFVHEADASPG